MNSSFFLLRSFNTFFHVRGIRTGNNAAYSFPLFNLTALRDKSAKSGARCVKISKKIMTKKTTAKVSKAKAHVSPPRKRVTRKKSGSNAPRRIVQRDRRQSLTADFHGNNFCAPALFTAADIQEAFHVYETKYASFDQVCPHAPDASIGKLPVSSSQEKQQKKVSEPFKSDTERKPDRQAIVEKLDFKADFGTQIGERITAGKIQVGEVLSKKNDAAASTQGWDLEEAEFELKPERGVHAQQAAQKPGSVQKAGKDKAEKPVLKPETPKQTMPTTKPAPTSRVEPPKEVKSFTKPAATASQKKDVKPRPALHFDDDIEEMLEAAKNRPKPATSMPTHTPRKSEPSFQAPQGSDKKPSGEKIEVVQKVEQQAEQQSEAPKKMFTMEYDEENFFSNATPISAKSAQKSNDTLTVNKDANQLKQGSTYQAPAKKNIPDSPIAHSKPNTVPDKTSPAPRSAPNPTVGSTSKEPIKAGKDTSPAANASSIPVRAVPKAQIAPEFIKKPTEKPLAEFDDDMDFATVKPATTPKSTTAAQSAASESKPNPTATGTILPDKGSSTPTESVQGLSARPKTPAIDFDDDDDFVPVPMNAPINKSVEHQKSPIKAQAPAPEKIVASTKQRESPVKPKPIPQPETTQSRSAKFIDFDEDDDFIPAAKPAREAMPSLSKPLTNQQPDAHKHAEAQKSSTFSQKGAVGADQTPKPSVPPSAAEVSKAKPSSEATVAGSKSTTKPPEAKSTATQLSASPSPNLKKAAVAKKQLTTDFDDDDEDFAPSVKTAPPPRSSQPPKVVVAPAANTQKPSHFSVEGKDTPTTSKVPLEPQPQKTEPIAQGCVRKPYMDYDDDDDDFIPKSELNKVNKVAPKIELPSKAEDRTVESPSTTNGEGDKKRTPTTASSAPHVKPQEAPKAALNRPMLYDDDDEEEDFIPAPKASASKPVAGAKPEGKKPASLFDDDDDDDDFLPPAPKKSGQPQPSEVKKPVSLFDDDDEDDFLEPLKSAPAVGQASTAKPVQRDESAAPAGKSVRKDQVSARLEPVTKGNADSKGPAADFDDDEEDFLPPAPKTQARPNVSPAPKADSLPKRSFHDLDDDDFLPPVPKKATELESPIPPKAVAQGSAAPLKPAVNFDDDDDAFLPPSAKEPPQSKPSPQKSLKSHPLPQATELPNVSQKPSIDFAGDDDDDDDFIQRSHEKAAASKPKARELPTLDFDDED